MKKSIIIIALIVIIIALALTYTALYKPKQDEPAQNQVINNNNGSDASTPAATDNTPNATSSSTTNTDSDIDTSDWRVYRNEEFGFEIKYPNDWYLYSDNSLDVFIQREKEMPDVIPGPHASAFEIKIKKIDPKSEITKLIKAQFDFAGVDFTYEPILIDSLQGYKVKTKCEGVGCGVPTWYVSRENILFQIKSNLGYESIFDTILSTFKFTEEDLSFSCDTNVVKDIEGNSYKTVKISSQCWMKENLKVAKNPQGKEITRYCYDDDPKTCETDGGLYDWNTAMNNSAKDGDQGICPNGWHVPTDQDWYVLESGLAIGSCDANRNGWDCDQAGTKLKLGGVSGFDGFLTGYRTVYPGENGFYDRNKGAYFWSSTQSVPSERGSNAIGRYLDLRPAVARSIYDIYNLDSFSVRCIKDY